MGSSSSAVIAENLMQYIDDKIINKLSVMLKFWRRYVEDIFIVSGNEDLTEILPTANS